MTQEYDPESDPADAVNPNELPADESVEDEPMCPSCGWELDAAGECDNPSCPDSPNFDPELLEDDELEDEDDVA